MGKKTLDIAKVYTGEDLKLFLELHLTNIDVVYIKNVEGRHLSRATIEEETLTDGSKVYDIILGFE